MKAYLVTSRQSFVRRVLNRLLGESYRAHTTMVYRLPFQKYVRVTVPDKALRHDVVVDFDIMQAVHILGLKMWRHEAVHVAQFSTWYGPYVYPLLATILPLPMFFSGRWFIERDAFLSDIRSTIGDRPHTDLCTYVVNEYVEHLHQSYLRPWPRPLMRKWFQKKLKAVVL